jgi:hypothetical protein
MPRKSKPRTPEQQERDTDLRLQRTYGITLAEYNERLAQQGGGCAICGKPPAAKRLHTDHCHKFAKQFKIVARKSSLGTWVAETVHRTDPLQKFFLGFGGFPSKRDAVNFVKKHLRRESVRGILCASCNRGLRFYFDKAELFTNAAEYLRTYAARTI